MPNCGLCNFDQAVMVLVFQRNSVRVRVWVCGACHYLGWMTEQEQDQIMMEADRQVQGVRYA